MANIIIDPAGEVWDANSGRLRMRYQVPISSAALPDYLIRNNGFIGIVQRERWCALRGAPGRISYAAFGRALEVIEECRPERISLSWFDGAWNDEIETSAQRAGKRLLALMLQLRSQSQQSYLSQPRDLASLTATHHHARILAMWRDAGGRIDPQADLEKIRAATRDKFLIVRHDRRIKALCFTAIGGYLDVYRDTKWGQVFNGNRVEAQPDARYGAWIANGYREALVAGQPQLSDIDAVVTDARSGDTLHHRYARLTLPIEGHGGERHLLSAPLTDASIDLSVKVQ